MAHQHFEQDIRLSGVHVLIQRAPAPFLNFATLAIALFLLVPALHSQSSSTLGARALAMSVSDTGRLKVRVDVHLTLVPVVVTDSSDHPVTGLSGESFRLFEDNVEQKVETFSKEEGPVSVVIVFDASGSMKEKLEPSLAAIKLLTDTAVQGDELSLVRFSTKPELVSSFVSQPDEIFQKLRFLEPKGWTAMRDAIFMGAREMRLAKNPSHVLLILSDGADNNSRRSESAIRNTVLESDLRVFSIGLQNHSRFLDKLAAATGGEAVVVQDINELPQAVAKISRIFRTQYVLGYSSNNPVNDGRYRKIRVQVTPPSPRQPLVVRSRPGYYSDSSPN